MINSGLRPFRYLSGKTMRTKCLRKGIHWDLDLDEGIDLCIYLLGAYEPKVLRAYSRVIKTGHVVFDIGANIGAHTLHFANLVGDSGRVFAFEPSDYGARKLKGNLELNSTLAKRVEFQQCFLVSEDSEALPEKVVSRWPVANEHSDLNIDHLGKPETLSQAVAVTADKVCENAKIARLDFVKIDVDGFEYPVLRGFQKNLMRFKPHILIEIAPFVYQHEKAMEFDDFVRFIARLGYSFTNANTGAQVPSDPVKLRRLITPGAALNCLLLPTPVS